MSTFAALRNRLGYLKRVRSYGSAETADLIQRNLPTIVAPLRPEGGRIRCDALDLTLDPARHGFYLQGMPHVRDLVESKTGRFVPNAAGEIEFQAGAIHIVPETSEELLILDEVFREQCYGFDAEGEWFVLDIGANVGIAALYFAGVKGCPVVAYEPFPETADAARRNIERSGLTERVDVRAKGVLDRDATLDLGFNPEYRGRNGLFGNTESKPDADAKVAAEFVDADRVVAEIQALAAGKRILAKIDCEGGEYAIVRRLRETGRLAAFDAILMEYHLLAPEHDEEALLRDLVASGFVVHTRPMSPQVGLMWAVKSQAGASR